MLSFLAIERQIIDWLRRLKVSAAPAPEKLLPVSRKMLFFMVTVLVFTVLVILLMLFQDINYILTHKTALGPQIYASVFKEILFAFSILLFLSFVIMGRYSRNMQRVLAIQVDVMKNVSGGEYYAQVPVVSNDEFGLIAAKTNDMISGLRERDLCRLSFGKYVTPEVSEKILKGEISPEGESSEVTVLFCDLRGYTPFVERRDPKDVVKFLNIYFTRMEQAIRKHNGIVLQYIGDEIEAVFGAPIHEPNHPQKAVLTALEMRKRLDDLNKERTRIGEAPIKHGIGIHTGVVLAGSVGSPERLVYAMVGDAVNVASRIQGLNKQFQTDILVSRTTMELLSPGKLKLVSLGQTAIRGKSKDIEVFKVL
jgi:class 3 adenylate cyclase